MPFIVPYYKKPAKIRERYKNVSTSQDLFTLQMLKSRKPTVRRPMYRISVKSFERIFIIAHGNDENEIRSKEWNYVTKKFPKIIPKNVDLTNLNRWCLAHFIVLGIDDKDKNDDELMNKYMGTELFDSSDSESDYEEDSTPQMRKTPKSTGAKKPIPPLSLVKEPSIVKSDRREIARCEGFSKLCLLLLGINAIGAIVRMIPLQALTNVVVAVNTALLTLLAVMSQGDRRVALSATSDSTGRPARSATLQRSPLRRLPVGVRSSPAHKIATSRRTKKKTTTIASLRRSPSVSFVEGLDKESRPTSFPKSKWSVTDGRGFHVRGSKYAEDGMKVLSSSSAFDVAGVDFFRCTRKVDNIGSIVTLPSPPHLKRIGPALRRQRSRPWHERPDGVPTYFIVNLMFPDYDPPMFSRDKTDGVGYSFVIYFCCKARSDEEGSDVDEEKDEDDHDKNARELWKRFVHSSLDGTSRSSMKGRFKSICKVANEDDLDLGYILANSLRKFNGKPFLVAPCQRFYEGLDYLEVDVDVHEFSYAARKGVRLMRDAVRDFVVDLVFFVEGRGEDELPERVLGAVRLDKLDISAAKPLDSLYELPKAEREKWDRGKLEDE